MLMRHAKSAWDDPKLSDHARPLNTRGRAAALAMRGVMRDLGLAPDVVLVSSARRTLQTLQALEPWDETPLIEPSDALYLAGPSQIVAALQAVPETTRSVLVIGHNPGLHEVAMLIAGPAAMGARDTMIQNLTEGYPTGALAEFSIPGPWSQIGEGAGRLIRFVAPRDLQEFSGEG